MLKVNNIWNGSDDFCPPNDRLKISHCHRIKRAKKQNGGQGQRIDDGRQAMQVEANVKSAEGSRNASTQIQASVKGTEASVDKFEDPQNLDIEDAADRIMDPVGIQPQPDEFSFLDGNVEPPSQSGLTIKANDADGPRSAASHAQVILTILPPEALASLIHAER